MTPPPWSHSRLSDFRNCSKQFYEVHIAKSVKVDYGVEASFGTYTHECFEKYLKHGTPLPDNVKHWQEYIDRIKAQPGKLYVECKYAIDRNLQPCSFFDKAVWCRAIVDTLHVDGQHGVAIDHKTGKPKKGTDQLRLSALLVFATHPEVETVDTRFEWLKNGTQTCETFQRSDIAKMWETFVPDLEAWVYAFKNEVFTPRVSGLCNGWCPVTSCEFWKPKRA